MCLYLSLGISGNYMVYMFSDPKVLDIWNKRGKKLEANDLVHDDLAQNMLSLSLNALPLMKRKNIVIP